MTTQTTNLGLSKPGAGDVDWAGELNDNFDVLDAMAYVSTPLFWNMLTTAPDVVGQGTWARAQSSSRLYGGDFTNTSAADGDKFTSNFRCPAGTYTLRFNAGKNTDGGIVKVYVDDVQVGNAGGYDTYSDPKDVLNIEEITGIAIGAGEHELKFVLDGKNASSEAYRFRAAAVWLQRTA